MVDTNTIVRSSWRVDSPEWTVALHLAQSGRIRLVVPDLVVVEAVARYASALKEDLSRMRNAIVSIRRMVPDGVPELPNVDLDAARDEFESAIRQRFAANRVAVPLADGVDVDDLARRAASRRRPFDSNGNGFRDATVWLLLVAEMTASPDAPATLVSNDNTFFGSDGALHEELAKELNSRSLGKVTAARSIGSFLVSFGVPDPALFQSMVETLNSTRAVMEADARNRLMSANLRTNDFGLFAQVVGVEEVTLNVVGATAVDDEEVALALFAVRFDDAVVEFHRAGVGQTAYAVTTPISGTATATFDRKARAFGDLDLELPAALDVLHAQGARLASTKPTTLEERIRVAGLLVSETMEKLLRSPGGEGADQWVPMVAPMQRWCEKTGARCFRVLARIDGQWGVHWDDEPDPVMMDLIDENRFGSEFVPDTSPRPQ